MTRNRRFGHSPTRTYTPGDDSRDAYRRAADAAAAARTPPRVKLRGLTIDDAAFVIDSWCGSFSRSPVSGPMDPQLFKIEQRARINRLLPRSKILIAADEADPKHIYGWVCFTEAVAPALPSIHYMCVKPEYQGLGIGKSLLDLVRIATGRTSTDPLFYTHWTVVCKKLERRWNLIYNSYLIEALT